MEQGFSFEKLIVYKRAKEYTIFVYSLIKQFPTEEKYAICDQLRRAEGTSRSSTKEKSHFIEIAYGSLMETYSQLDIAKDLNYIDEVELNVARTKVVELKKLLTALRKSYAAELQCRVRSTV